MMPISYVSVILGMIGLLVAFMTNIILIAYQWGKFQQIVHELKSVVEELRDSIKETSNKTNTHGERLSHLEALYQRMPNEY